MFLMCNSKPEEQFSVWVVEFLFPVLLFWPYTHQNASFNWNNANRFSKYFN